MRADLESPVVPAVSGHSASSPASTESDALESHIGAMTDRELLEAIYRHILTAESAVSNIAATAGPIIAQVQESPLFSMLRM